MSNISDERLVVEALKHNQQALEELKIRIKPKIRNIIKKGARSYKGDIEALEVHTLENVVNSLDSYQFKIPFQAWIGTRSRNIVIRHIQQRGDYVKVKPLSIAQLQLSSTSVSKKQPQVEQIDVEIRSLVGLLNQSRDICTISSCSGHPDRKVWGTRRNWESRLGGWISIVPTGNPIRALEFLIGVLTKIDNAEHSNPPSQATPDNTIRQRYQKVDANALFCSGIPIVGVGVNLCFFACHPNVKHNLEIWKHLITVIREMEPENEELTTEVDTPEIAVQLLEKALPRLHSIFSARYVTSQEGYPGIKLHKMVDLTLCQQLLILVNRLYERLDNAGYKTCYDIKENPSFVEKWNFNLQPILNSDLIRLPHLSKTTWEQRTSEDHLNIWRLLELAVAEQL